MNEVSDNELNSCFVAPEKEFMGDTLAPYTEGSRLLLMQVRDETDSPTYFVWSFLFIHIELKKNKREAIKLCWDKNLFREKLMDWVSDKTENERDKATSLVAEIVEEANRGAVETISSGGPPGKA